MKANKEFSQYLTAQAEKIELAAWELVDRFDRGEDVTPESVKDLKERAARLLSDAQNKTELKRLNKILSSAIYNLKGIA